MSTPGDWRIRGVGGLFYENYQIQEQVDWFYVTALPYFYPIGPPTGYYTLNGSPLLPNGQPVTFATQGAVLVPSPVTSNNPNVRPPSDGFFDDVTRGYKQEAAYASVDWDLIPKELTLRPARATSMSRPPKSARTSGVLEAVNSFTIRRRPILA